MGFGGGGFAPQGVGQSIESGEIATGAVTASKLGYGSTASAIGTRTLRNVNLPWALGQGLAVASGTIQAQGTTSIGTVRASRLILQTPIRASAGSVGLGTVRAAKLGYGATASAIGTRTLRNVNLPWALGQGFTVSSGTIHNRGTSQGTVRATRLILQSPVRQETSGGSVGLGTVRAAKLGYGATASAIGTRTLRNVNLPWALGQGFTVSSGTIQTRGTTSGGTVRATRLILQSPVRQETSGGSVGLGTVRAAKLGYGATASAIGTRTLRNVNLPWALGTGFTVSSGTIQTRGTTAVSGTVKQQNIGTFSITNPSFDPRTWLYSRTHSFWEGWLDNKSGARNTIPGGIGMGSFAKLEYGGLGIASLTWTRIGAGSFVYRSPGTAWVVLGSNTGVRARGTYARWFVLDYAFGSFPPASPVTFKFMGTYSVGARLQGTFFGFHLSRGSAGTLAFVGRGGGGAGTISYIISGTANQGRGVRRQIAALRTGGGSWVFMKDMGADAGWKVVGKATDTRTPVAFQTSMMAGVAGSVRVFRVFLSGEGR